MYFKRIEMHGFKSFADPVTIEFSDGLTCIVGPNGSGKSNVSDAIRWVLGEQSPKMLRGGRMEEVIFSGTAGRRSRGMAEVTLVIDNSDGILPIDYNEVAITRRMFRSGESEYYINGSQCRLRDIRELIMDTGIGVDGYSIIGQGRISDILSSRTESRREIFEEAAGIVMYRNRKAESERKFDAGRANMDRVNDIIGEIESRIDGLREDSVRAKEYLELRDRYKELEINIVLKNIESANAKNEEIKKEAGELAKDIAESAGRKDLLEKEAAQQNERLRDVENAAEEARSSLFRTVDEMNAIVSRAKVDRQRLISISENEERILEELADAEKKLAEEREKREGLVKASEEAQARADSAAEDLRMTEREEAEVSARLAGIEEKNENARSRIFDISSIMSSHRAEIKSLEMLSRTLSERREKLLSEKSTGEDSGRENIDRLNRLKAEKTETDGMLAGAREELAGLRASAESMENEERSLKRSVDEMRVSIGRLEARKKTIEEMENNYEGYNGAVRFVMHSQLKGIHGVVADLIDVPAGYETAIETALGASLQNIVCEDDDSAKAAIRSLKENRAGRMTFLPVSSVRGSVRRDDRVKDERGFLGFGPDCIDYDSRYDGIISYLLGRVVIVDDMDNAVRMSKKGPGLRYVTRDGEVINAGGGITGGKYRNRTANLLDRKAEIASLRSGIDKMQGECDRSSRELEEIAEKKKALARDIATVSAALQEKEREALEKEHELRMTEAAINDIRSDSRKLDKELAGIDAENENSAAMTAEINEKIRKLEDELASIEETSRERQDEQDRVKNEAAEIAEKMTQARVKAEGCRREKEHIESLISSADASGESIRETISAKKKELERLAAEKAAIGNGSDADEEARKKSEQREDLEKRIEELSREKAEITERTEKISAERDAVSHDLENLQKRKYELEIKSTRNEAQIDSQKDRLWEDFEVSYIQAMEFRSEEFVMSQAVRENRQIKARLRELGEVNVGAIEEYETVKERYDFLLAQRADIQKATDDLEKMIKEMDATIRKRFKESFDMIAVNFEEEFRELFGGGHAELRLSDESDPLDADIDIVAQPPGKKLQNINLMSGGEKTLTAIALMFAVLRAKPTPFCILDEVEAALDDANIDRFIACLRKFTGIQFALVTHQKATMEHADVLYGVTMPEKGVSKVLSLGMGERFEEII